MGCFKSMLDFFRAESARKLSYQNADLCRANENLRRENETLRDKLENITQRHRELSDAVQKRDDVLALYSQEDANDSAIDYFVKK